MLYSEMKRMLTTERESFLSLQTRASHSSATNQAHSREKILRALPFHFNLSIYGMIIYCTQAFNSKSITPKPLSIF